MTDAKSWLSDRVRRHLPRNATKYTPRIWTGQPLHNSFAMRTFHEPIEGTVVDQDSDFTLIKKGASTFAVFPNALANHIPAIGDKVKATFYRPRDFQGLLTNGSEDPQSTVIVVGAAQTNLPYTWTGRYSARQETVTSLWSPIHNQRLRDMVLALEGTKVDHTRSITDLLVCANAINLKVCDPNADSVNNDDRASWPSLSMDLCTTKFIGSITIRYDQASDGYELELRDQQGTLDNHDNLDAHAIADLLMRKVDDGTWMTVLITVLKKAAKKREVADVQ